MIEGSTFFGEDSLYKSASSLFWSVDLSVIQHTVLFSSFVTNRSLYLTGGIFTSTACEEDRKFGQTLQKS